MRNFLRRAWPSILLFVGLMIISYFLGVTRSTDWRVLSYTEPVGSFKFAQDVSLQASIAFLIALAVYEITERIYQKQKAEAQAEASSKVAQAATETMLGVFFDAQTLKAVMGTIFSSPIVRDRLSMHYEFENHPRSDKLVRLIVTTDYVLRNASASAQDAAVKLIVSNMMADHPDDPCFEKSRILSISIDGKDLPSSRIDRLNHQIKPSDRVCRLEVEKKSLSPGKSRRVLTEIETLKLVNDSEVMQLVYPTRNVEVTVQNNTDKDLCMNMNGIYPLAFPEAEKVSQAKKKLRWTPDGVFLNHNGWVLYWMDLGKPLSE